MANDTHARTIALFGGSFNPPHVAHVCMAAWALSIGDVDELWILPTGGHPFGKDLAPFDHRMEMCRRAFDLFGDRVRVLDIEREERVHYSVDTLKLLMERHPGVQWRWVIGTDALAQSADWKDFDELERLAPLLVIGREGAPECGAHPAFTLPDISSTFIRDRLASGESDELLRDIVPRTVLDYIHQHGLYGSRLCPR